MIFVLIGVAAGAQGLALISPAILTFLDPAVPVALVAIGLIAGLHVRGGRGDGARRAAAASVESFVTAAVVFAGILLLAPGWGAAEGFPYWFLAIAVAVSAASWAADDLLPIVTGGIILALLREPSPPAALALALQACAVALVIALAARLLLGSARSETEQRVFAIAVLLLLGGAADFLSLSALMIGLVAGLFLDAAGGSAREAIRRDVQYVQHPLLVLMLVVTGASIEVELPWLALAAEFLVLSIVGRYAGEWVARRVSGAAPLRDVERGLLAPGIVGVAFALNLLRAAGGDAAPALAVVAFAAVGNELLAMAARSGEVRA